MRALRLSRLFFIAILLAFTVIVLGAYTRLTDAGLGCPDWPGCYGQLTAPSTDHDVKLANSAFPQAPVEITKAKTEMTHRYFAESLGVLIVFIALVTFFQRTKAALPLTLPLVLVALVIFQGLLGMWTVTLRLFPLAVMGHLLGGFCTLSLLWIGWLHLRVNKNALDFSVPCSLRWLSLFFTVLVFGQILLGGWTSANYAALSCPDFPTCQGQWLPSLNIPQAFHFLTGLNSEHPLSAMDHTSRMTIHFIHRVGAICVLITGIIFIWRLSRIAKLKQASFFLIGILLLQLTLGVSNVLFSLPLKVAVAHNAIAALLLLTLLMIHFILHHAKRGEHASG